MDIKSIDRHRKKQREFSIASTFTTSFPKRYCRFASRQQHAGSDERAVVQRDLTCYGRVYKANLSRFALHAIR